MYPVLPHGQSIRGIARISGSIRSVGQPYGVIAYGKAQAAIKWRRTMTYELEGNRWLVTRVRTYFIRTKRGAR